MPCVWASDFFLQLPPKAEVAYIHFSVVMKCRKPAKCRSFSGVI